MWLRIISQRISSVVSALAISGVLFDVFQEFCRLHVGPDWGRLTHETIETESALLLQRLCSLERWISCSSCPQITVIISSLDIFMVLVTLMLSFGFGFVVDSNSPIPLVDHGLEPGPLRIAYSVLSAFSSDSTSARGHSR